MAKKKRRKSLLPKRIAGVKVPKSVRKGRFGELLASHTGRALLAEAVLAAGAIGAAKKAGDAGADKAGDGPSLRSFASGVAERLQHGGDGKEAGAALAFALGEAARVFVSALSEHRHGHAAAADAQPAEAGGSKKKPSSAAADQR